VSAPPYLWAPPDAWSEEEVRIPTDESHHALTVLRLGEGAEVAVIDGDGRLARCVLGPRSRAGVGARILEVFAQPTRPDPQLVVYQGAAKGAKVDGVIERLAALGVAETRVFSSERSVVSWDETKRARLEARWTAVARSAAKQSRSPWIMGTGSPLAWPELLASVESERDALVLWEEATEGLRDALSEGPRLALVVGPEGGLSSREATGLAEAGGRLVSLGPRILRTEEAAVVAAAGLLWHFGTIG
jgi:16S rRNA (uracil1498-N3)-methyltransferase